MHLGFRLPLIAAIACFVVVSNVSATDNVSASGGPNHKLVSGEPFLGDDAAWPSVATNQEQVGRPKFATQNHILPDPNCPDPCVGGSGCTGWESSPDSGCRTSGDGNTKECVPLYNRRCAYKEGNSGLIDCKTCMVD